MENMNKKEAAFQVAAMHHDFLEKATHKYMELTGQVSEEFKQKLDDMCTECLDHYQFVTEKKITCEDIQAILDCNYPAEITSDDSFRVAQKEMLKPLPGYRHPVAKRIIEHEIFFGDTGAEVGPFFGCPLWTRNESIINLSEPLHNELVDYTINAEWDKIRLRRLRKENEELQELLAKAHSVYKKLNNKDDSHSRNKRVVEALGLSSGKKGNRQSIDHQGAYQEYVWLVRKGGKSRKEALGIVQREFGYSSVDTARKSLFNELKKVKDWWRSRDGLDSVLYNHCAAMERFDEWLHPKKERIDILKTYWSCLVPSKKR